MRTGLPADLDCPNIGKKVRVVGPDEHRLDANKDGWGLRELRLTQGAFALHRER